MSSCPDGEELVLGQPGEGRGLVAQGEGRDFGRRLCPTCRAPRRGEPICHRCKSDLAPLLELEERVDALRAQAQRCYARGWYRQAAALAREIISLEGSPDDSRFLACSLLWFGDFQEALSVCTQIHSAK